MNFDTTFYRFWSDFGAVWGVILRVLGDNIDIESEIGDMWVSEVIFITICLQFG